jgi:HD-like signal output (HDOD) protein
MNKHLLFVDDEPLVLQGMRRALHSMRQEWKMTFVEGAAAALEALRQQPYDAIISDMRMPVMDGALLLEEVKKSHPEVVRVVLSGQSSRDALLRSIAPAHQYLTKPCDPQELKTRLAQAFAMRDLLGNETVKALVSGLKTVPSLPAVYDKLMAELRSEDASIAKIAKIISKDVGMTAKILQLANSAFIGLRCRVSSPAHAVSVIGTEMVRSLVLSVHVFCQFEGRAEVASYWPALWTHSVQAATLAQRIAASMSCPKALGEECFTAGLLHDIGKVILLAEMPRQYQQILQQASAGTATVMSAEKECLGCTHAQVGAYLMGIWGLPHPLVNAVAFHDCPSESVDRQFSSLTAVHCADAIIAGGDTAAVNQDVQLDTKYLADLGLSEKESLWRGLHDEVVGADVQKGAL